MEFFNKLEWWRFSIDLILNNGSLDYYSLIKVNANDEVYELDDFHWTEKLVWDNVMPTPVFFNIIKNTNWPEIYWNEEYFRKFFENKFWLKVENVVERENEEYYYDEDEVSTKELLIDYCYWVNLSD